MSVTPNVSRRLLAVDRQEYTTDTVVINQRMLTGYGYAAAPADSNLTVAITFPITFSRTPTGYVNYCGEGSGTDFANKTISNNAYRGYGLARQITTTGFTAQLVNTAGNWNANGATTLFFNWGMIG